jgi:hypothetical protein
MSGSVGASRDPGNDDDDFEDFDSSNNNNGAAAADSSNQQRKSRMKAHKKRRERKDSDASASKMREPLVSNAESSPPKSWRLSEKDFHVKKGMHLCIGVRFQFARQPFYCG